MKEAKGDAIKEWSYDEVEEFVDDAGGMAFKNKRVFDLAEMLGRKHRTIYFIQPYLSQKHSDYRLALLPPVQPSAFITNPILTNSNYVLQLSDLHFGTGHHGYALGNDEAIQKKLSTLIIDDLRRVHRDTKPAAVIISGDLTWQGQKEEFEYAADFIRRLSSAFDLAPHHFVIIPGNHDMQWGDQTISDYDRTAKVTRPVDEAQRNYRQFFKEVFGVVPASYLSMGRRYILRNYVPIDICGINSSMLEAKHFAGYGYVSLEQLDKVAEAMEWSASQTRAKFRLLVLHHHIVPVTPQEEITSYDRIYSLTLDAGQIIYRALELEVDLVVHGHMHQPFASSVSRLGKGSRVSGARKLAVHGAGSAGVTRGYLGAIGKNSYTIYSFDSEGIGVDIRSWGENINGFEEDWHYRLSCDADGGLKMTSPRE